MSKRTRMVIAVVAVAALALLLGPTVMAEAAETDVYVSNMYATFWALVPPIVAIVLALITREVYCSLFVGIVVGALFHANFQPVMAMDVLIKDGFIGAIANTANAGIFLFLVILGIMVALINQSGASAAFGRWAQKNIKGRVGAQLATFALGVLVFIDDYFNCLTVGSVMRPVADKHRVSRAKLSYLIDATAAPICMIAPISSWASAVSGVAEDIGNVNGIELFIRAIPYNFYSLLTLVFVVALVVMRFDYGPMKMAELNARLGNDPDATEGSELTSSDNPRTRVFDLIIPVIVLIISCMGSMLYMGGFFSGSSLVDAFSGTDVYSSLPWGALIALIITAIYYVARRVVSFSDAMACIPKGFTAMAPALIILTFALTLKNVTGLLGADVFVFNLMQGAADGLFNLLPAVIFLVACFLAFSTGTSWGTFSILIPIVLPIFQNNSELMIIGISACLAGAVCGDHCSPISDTTIMASAGAMCKHVSHVSTQLPYVITVAIISFVCYIVAGFVQNVFISLGLGIVLTIGALVLLRQLTRGKNEPAA